MPLPGLTFQREKEMRDGTYDGNLGVSDFPYIQGETADEVGLFNRSFTINAAIFRAQTGNVCGNEASGGTCTTGLTQSILVTADESPGLSSFELVLHKNEIVVKLDGIEICKTVYMTVSDGGINSYDGSRAMDRSWSYITLTNEHRPTSSHRLRIYENGVLQITCDATPAVAMSPYQKVAIGQNPSMNDTSWIGRIRGVRVYDFAMEPDNIAFDANQVASQSWFAEVGMKKVASMQVCPSSHVLSFTNTSSQRACMQHIRRSRGCNQEFLIYSADGECGCLALGHDYAHGACTVSNTTNNAIFQVTSEGCRDVSAASQWDSNCWDRMLEIQANAGGANFNLGSSFSLFGLTAQSAWKGFQRYLYENEPLKYCPTPCGERVDSFCPSSHPFAFRPSSGHDRCCRTEDDCDWAVTERTYVSSFTGSTGQTQFTLPQAKAKCLEVNDCGGVTCVGLSTNPTACTLRAGSASVNQPSHVQLTSSYIPVSGCRDSRRTERGGVPYANRYETCKNNDYVPCPGGKCHSTPLHSSSEPYSSLSVMVALSPFLSLMHLDGAVLEIRISVWPYL